MTINPARPEQGSPAGPDGFHHHYEEVNGTTIHAVVGGSGPAVVLVHGWPFTWRAWRPVLAPLAATGYTVIAPDLHGIGDSAKPDTGYNKREVASDLRQLAAALGHDRVSLVGMDIGTMVAYAWASEYPDSVEKVVLSESVLPGFGLEELMNPATGGFWHFGFHMQAELAAFLTEGKEAAYIAPMLDMMVPNLDPADRDAILASYSAPGRMLGGFGHYQTLLVDGKENREKRRKLPMPVLVLNGENGLPQAPLLDGARRAASDVVADTVPGTGHAYAAENPTWTVERLHRFFGASDV